jgi:hypothetical protein
MMTRAAWIELLLVTCVAAVLAAAIPLYAGQWSWSWDALNHHVYLGYIAEQPRWHLDVMAASVQSWQYPYLYWPVYRLSQLNISGAAAGAIWGAGLAMLLTPPVWVMSWKLLQSSTEPKWQLVFDRVAACVLAGSSVVVISAVNTTSNDPLAAVPLLWALALMAGGKQSTPVVSWAGALLGASIALKLSHILALPLLLVWAWSGKGLRATGGRALALGLATLAGYTVVYLPWGWQLWRVTGSAFHPLIPGAFAP